MSKKTSEILSMHTEDLPCRLSNDEVMVRANRMADVEQELERHTGLESQIKSDLKATRSRLEAERGRLAGQVRSKSELRPIEIEHIADFRAGTVREIRTDTGEVRARSLSAAERQGALKLHDEGPASA